MPTTQNLVLRGTKGAPLTFQEVDNNFQVLLELANDTVDNATFTVLQSTVNNQYLELQGDIDVLEGDKYDATNLATSQQSTSGSLNTPGSINNSTLMTPYTTALAIDQRVNPTSIQTSIQNLENNKYDIGDLATEQQAREGFLSSPGSIDNTTLMTPLRVAQSIDERASKLTIGLVLALGG